MSETRFNCTSCGKSYRWKAEIAGKKVRCKCSQVLRVPTTEPGEGAADDMYALNTTPFDKMKSQPVAAPAAVAGVGGGSCPSCGNAVKPGAVICVGCGFNFKTGKSLDTAVGRAVKVSGGSRHANYSGSMDGYFGRLGRSWEFAKIAYGILWDFKQLIVFPLFSGAALLVVLASFILPMWGMGTMDQLAAFMDDETAVENVNPVIYAIAFGFYFLNFFVIVFFNTALAACALKVCAGETPTIGYGFSIAMKRLPQIVGWALLSASVGLILKVIENIHEKAGLVIAAIIGTAWSVLTYFVVPVLAAEGVGPFKAVKESVSTLKETWGEAVLGNFSMGFLTFIVTLPLYLIFGAITYLGINSGNIVIAVAGVVGLIISAMLSAAVSSAADIVFRALLYNYATGRTIPAEVDEEMFAAAFASKG